MRLHHPTPDELGFEAAERLYIDPDACIDRGLCAEACPVRATYPEDDLPDEWRPFVEANAAYYRA